MMDRGKSPKWKSAPEVKKKVTVHAQPESNNTLTPAWQFHRIDKDHQKWGWSKLSSDEFCGVIHEQLCHFETMTWAEIYRAVADKKSGNMHHNIDTGDIVKDAQTRLIELRLDDVDQIFSMRLSNKIRLWGIKDGRALRFIWHDANHEICPRST